MAKWDTYSSLLKDILSEMAWKTFLHRKKKKKRNFRLTIEHCSWIEMSDELQKKNGLENQKFPVLLISLGIHCSSNLQLYAIPCYADLQFLKPQHHKEEISWLENVHSNGKQRSGKAQCTRNTVKLNFCCIRLCCKNLFIWKEKEKGILILWTVKKQVN